MNVFTSKVIIYIILSIVILGLVSIANFKKENPDAKLMRVLGIIGSTIWVVGIEQASPSICTGIVILFLSIWIFTSYSSYMKVKDRDEYNPKKKEDTNQDILS